MVDLKVNFSSQYLDENCIFGCNESDSQYYLLNCETIIKHCPKLYNDQEVELDDMYDNIDKQEKFVKLMVCVMNIRGKLQKS